MSQGAEEQVRIAHDDLVTYLEAAFLKGGMTGPEAGVTARVLADADLGGVYSHGCVRFPDYVHLVRQGRWHTGVQPSVLADVGALLLLDGGHGVGPFVAMTAMQHAVDRARMHGASWVWVRNGGHFGQAAAYTSWAAREGCIALAFTNSSAAMAAWGGRDAVLGANPWSMALPCGPERWPLVLDMANTVAARGWVKLAAARGEPLPAGWALDAAGDPATDPLRALAGSMLPFGGHKGYAIAFMVEALTAVVAGSAMSVEVRPPVEGDGTPQGLGQVFAAIDVGALLPLADLEARLDRLRAMIRAGGAGAGEILVPGEREALTAERQAREGIVLTAATRAALTRGAALVGLPLSDAWAS